MRKQTQSRQYGYVSPKCKFVTLTQNLGFCQSEPGQRWIDGGAGTYSVDEIINNGEY